MDITREISDAVCTAITVGHLLKASEKRDDKRIPIVYEDDSEAGIHDTLKNKIEAVVGRKDFIKFEKSSTSISEPTNKKMLIIAKPGNFTFQETDDINKELYEYMRIINDKLNRYKENNDYNLYGAYIGGKYNCAYNELKLYTASTIYKKKRMHTIEQGVSDSLQKKYRQNLNTVKCINESINTLKNSKGSFKYVKIKIEEPNLFNININTHDTLGKDEIFASVHGLVTAIVYYNLYNSIDPNVIPCEYACSDDTTKVGSCIPCSIFASSNETPSNYTHFGRGDYWNLPQESKGYQALMDKRKNWETYVKDCFILGTKELNDVPAINKIAKIDEKDENKNIPEIFLHSLMYEGKFTDKMIHALGI